MPRLRSRTRCAPTHRRDPALHQAPSPAAPAVQHLLLAQCWEEEEEEEDVLSLPNAWKEEEKEEG